jgi:hypothetical protein
VEYGVSAVTIKERIPGRVFGASLTPVEQQHHDEETLHLNKDW